MSKRGAWHLMCCPWHESPQISHPPRSPLHTVAFQRVKTGQPALLDLPILILREHEGLHRKSRSLTVYKFEIKRCRGTERTQSWASGCDCVHGQLLKKTGREEKIWRKERFERGCDTRYRVMMVTVQGQISRSRASTSESKGGKMEGGWHVGTRQFRSQLIGAPRSLALFCTLARGEFLGNRVLGTLANWSSK